MTVVGITGSAGFFGWHLRCRLHTFGLEYRLADRTTFADPDALDAFVVESDVVVHLAGVNRANSDEEVASGNTELAQALAVAQARTGTRLNVIYAISIKADEPGMYGEAKAKAAEILSEATAPVDGYFVDILFPHLFGEFGVPFYNSGVTTFAHQLVAGEPSQVNEGQLELMHVQDAAQLIMDMIEKGASDQLRRFCRPDPVRKALPTAYEKPDCDRNAQDERFHARPQSAAQHRALG